MYRKTVTVLQIASVFIGTVVGAGFASGKEIIQFFTQYGMPGTFGAMIGGLLMAAVGSRTMVYARRIEAYSANELLSRLFGDRIGTILQCLIFLMMFGMTGVMLAGAGAVFREQLGGPPALGIGIILVTGLFFLVRGTRGLLWINSLVVPALVTFVLILLFNGGLQPAPAKTAAGGVAWLVSAVGYAAFNLVSALIVLVPLARDTKDERLLRAGGWLGGIGLALLLLAAHLMLLRRPSLLQFDMPMAELVRPLGTLLHFFFVNVILGEILSTFVGNIYGLSRQLVSAFPNLIRPLPAALLPAAGALLIGQLDYGELIRVLYPLYGFLCAALFLALCFLHLPEEME